MSSLAGTFLVARTVLQDPNFRQTVVLLLEHGEEGAFGLVVNRPKKVDELPFPVYSGGPCPAQGLMMLHGHADWATDEPGKEVCPGVFLGDADCLQRVSESLDDDEIHFRVFSGYAGWGPGQLEGEIASGAWVSVPATGELMFNLPVEQIWSCLGPPRIPQPSLN